jgi:hypothetical protein
MTGLASWQNKAIWRAGKVTKGAIKPTHPQHFWQNKPKIV